MKTNFIQILGCSFLFLFLSSTLWAQKENKLIREGNKAYQKNKFDEADVAYRKALDKNANSFEAYFNLGNALYKQGQFDEAEVKFNRAAQLSDEKGSLAMAHYNKGNALLKQNKYEDAIESYKESLRNYPGDPDAIYNLSYAMQKLASQKKGENNQDKSKDDKDGEEDKDGEDQKGENDKKDDQKDKKDQDGGDKDQENKDQNQQKDQQDKDGEEKDDKSGKGSEEGKDGEDKGTKAEGAETGISPEDAIKLLEALEDDEKKVQAKIMLRKGKGKKVKVEKEW